MYEHCLVPCRTGFKMNHLMPINQVKTIWIQYGSLINQLKPYVFFSFPPISLTQLYSVKFTQNRMPFSSCNICLRSCDWIYPYLSMNTPKYCMFRFCINIAPMILTCGIRRWIIWTLNQEHVERPQYVYLNFPATMNKLRCGQNFMAWINIQTYTLGFHYQDYEV